MFHCFRNNYVCHVASNSLVIGFSVNFYLLCASSHGGCSVEMTSCSRMDLEFMSSLCAEGGLPCLRLLLIYGKTLKCSMILSCHVFY